MIPQANPRASVNCLQMSIMSPVSTTPAAATPPLTPTARNIPYRSCQPSFPSNKDEQNTYPANTRSEYRPHTTEQSGLDITTIEQDLQRRDIVDDDRPRHSARATRKVIIPDQQQERKQLGEARDQQGGADQRRARVMRND